MKSSTRVLQFAAIGLAIATIAVARPRESLGARTADPTYAEDVAPILFKNCTSCHRTGGQAPFSMLYYDSLAPFLGEIKTAVSTGAMPPWHAEGPHGVFRNDRRLSPAEKALILKWVETGGQPGDMKKLPPRPEYPSTWAMGTPDLVTTMQEEFTVPASGTIEYMHFQVPTNLTEEKWVRAIEIKPGAREVVHHVLVYARVPAPAPVPGAAPATPPAARPAGAPAPQPLLVRNPAHAIPDGPPRKDTLYARPRQTGPLIASTAPGTNVVEFPAGTALRLRPGTILTFQMHYTAHGMEMKDRTSVGFKFTEMPEEEILANQFTNGAFTIPAGAKDVAIPAELGVSQPIRLWGMLPHTHLRGTRWLYKLEKPDGTSEVVLDMPKYDFNWQTYYLFAKPLEMPAGSKLTSMAWYDNSATNKSNPNPNVDVKWGDQTWEEMQYTGILYSVPSRRLRPAP
jgi:hypothetical protein